MAVMRGLACCDAAGIKRDARGKFTAYKVLNGILVACLKQISHSVIASSASDEVDPSSCFASFAAAAMAARARNDVVAEP